MDFLWCQEALEVNLKKKENEITKQITNNHTLNLKKIEFTFLFLSQKQYFQLMPRVWVPQKLKFMKCQSEMSKSHFNYNLTVTAASWVTQSNIISIKQIYKSFRINLQRTPTPFKYIIRAAVINRSEYFDFEWSHTGLSIFSDCAITFNEEMIPKEISNNDCTMLQKLSKCEVKA